MLEPQNISTTGTTSAGLSASVAAKPREKDAEVRESTSLLGDDASGVRDNDASSAQDEDASKTLAPETLVGALAQSEPRARIGYSFEEKEPYIEILNPRTGDVIQRFPAEDAEDELRTFTQGDAGVFIDRVA